MASISYWVISPGMFLALLGKIRGWERTKPTPSVDWRTVTVDVVIPAKDEENSLALCLSSVFQQDFPIRSITVVDDGSKDRTSEAAHHYCDVSGHAVNLIRREKPQGKTPSVREITETSDADAIFVVDADTVLLGRDYISKVVEELFKNAGVAAVCGQVMPLTRGRRKELIQGDPHLQQLRRKNGARLAGETNRRESLFSYLTVLYRSALYVYLQRILYDGHLKLFGTQLNPVGCGVVYKADRLRECFAYARERVGDNLSMSEDIYIGHYFNWKGYRNVQVSSARCESTEPRLDRLPRQMFLWGSAFLQSVHYFKELPVYSFKRVTGKLRRSFSRSKDQQGGAERRRIGEQYRAPWGEDFTRREGRSVGFLEIAALLEKVSYPLVLLVLLFYSQEVFLITLAAEAAGCALCVLIASDSGQRLRFAAMMLASTPIRFASLGMDVIVFLRYLTDLLTGNRQWRK